MTYEAELKEAIQREDDMYDFYVALAKQNKEFNDFFMKLALEELKHRRLLEFFEKTGDFSAALEKASRENVISPSRKNVFENYGQKDVEQIWKLAIKKEEESYELYKTLEINTSIKKLKELFSRLKDWEDGHRLMLQKKYEKLYP